jgi:hypothetical protein
VVQSIPRSVPAGYPPLVGSCWLAPANVHYLTKVLLADSPGCRARLTLSQPGNTVRLSRMNLTAVAAFLAAGLSLVNVAYSAYLARRGHREQWRREQERPIVARALTLSYDAQWEWADVSAAKPDMATDASADAEGLRHMRQGVQLLGDLRYQVAQLDLLASPAVRQVARALALVHANEAVRLAKPPKPDEDHNQARQASQNAIRELEKALVERTRADLGISSSLRVPRNSILGRMLARKS